MHSGGFELTKLTYTRLEENLIRHRGDRVLLLPEPSQQQKKHSSSSDDGLREGRVRMYHVEPQRRSEDFFWPLTALSSPPSFVSYFLLHRAPTLFTFGLNL